MINDLILEWFGKVPPQKLKILIAENKSLVKEYYIDNFLARTAIKAYIGPKLESFQISKEELDVHKILLAMLESNEEAYKIIVGVPNDLGIRWLCNQLEDILKTIDYERKKKGISTAMIVN